MRATIDIDQKSGFCFGVVNAVKIAEEELEKGTELLSLGDIVHNNIEVSRLENKGLKTIDQTIFEQLQNKTVLLRAHGEPPETYKKAAERGVKIVDATCPVVLKLQERVLKSYHKSIDDNGQIVIFGKLGHPEVNGLVGQTDGNAIVISKIDEVEKIDFSRPVRLFAQTTMTEADYLALGEVIKSRMTADCSFDFNNTLCKQVSGRVPGIAVFAKAHDVIVFVGGLKSSNAKVLFAECTRNNSRSHFVTQPSEIIFEWFADAKTIGICGATSTPMWLMEKVKEAIEEMGI